MTCYDETVALVKEVLTADEMSFTELACDDEQFAVELRIWGDHVAFLPQVGVRCEAGLLYAMVAVPFTIPDDRRYEVAEAMVRINSRLQFGHFSMDFTKGRAHFENALPLPDCAASAGQIRTLVYTALASADEYARVFARLSFDLELSAAEAVAEVDLAEIPDA